VKIGSYTGASPALAGGWAYFGTFDNEVMGANLQARRIGWRYEHPQRKFPFYSSAAVQGSKVYVGGRDKMLHALDTKTGKPAWTFMTKARIDSSPAITDTRIWFGSNDGNFYAVDANSGKESSSFTAGAPISASPAIANDRIVIGAQDGRLYCFGS
jgi:outer membrane protein assembly factor BamB